MDYLEEGQGREMATKKYRIGIDVGLKSVGLAAIQVDENEMPLRILNAQSVIHDGGVDPNTNKTGDSRRAQSGLARRTRRMRRNRRKRLRKLDALLHENGFPIVPDNKMDWSEPWTVRAEAADSLIEDENLRKRAISISCRHIARHRGWRNPYQNVRTLLHVEEPSSKFYEKLVSNAAELFEGELPPADATPAQIVRWAQEKNLTLRLRKSTAPKRKDRVALFPEKMMQEDYAYELRMILSKQCVEKPLAEKLMLAVFESESPKGSAEKRVGKDPLASDQPRALRASMAYQRYRIANIITNLRLRDGGPNRPLTVKEKQDLFSMLVNDSSSNKQYSTWTDIASEMGWQRRDLVGVGQLTSDGEDRVTSRPPHVDFYEKLAAVKDKELRGALMEWWKNATETEREAMISLLANAVDIEKKREDQDYISATEFIDELDDVQLGELDSISLESGRAAYSVKTLNALTDKMLTTPDDLHEARKDVFGVGDSWRPPQAEIGAPLGNPAVDRVAKIVNRWLLACEHRWGKPESIQIEHVRNAFSSEPTARAEKKQYEDYLSARNKKNERIRQELRTNFDVDEPHGYDIRRAEAITRQGGKCLYCDTPITFLNCEMDHIVPRKGVGSTNTRDNFAAVCVTCNRQKSNLPFAAWCTTDAARDRDITVKAAVNRVKSWNIGRNDYPNPQAFKRAVIMRLQQTEADPEIDNRSIESVAWMADELHRRIDWHFNHGRSNGDSRVNVAVYQGKLTAEARHVMMDAANSDFHFVGGHGKTRLDRRHHAVDASVIAMMTPAAAQTLVQRINLRETQRAVGRIDVEDGEVDWKDWPVHQTEKYAAWLEASKRLLGLLNDALDHDRIPVVRWQRYSLGNSQAHEETIHKLLRVRLGDAIDADVIRRSSTPAQYCALTRCADYSEKDGLPENPERSININGQILHADDDVTFFESKAAQIAVQGGSADIGNAIHHARVYRYYQVQKNGNKKFAYGMIRVFQCDLLHAKGKNLFEYPLAPQSVSLRYAEPKVARAVENGQAEYLGYLVVGDEIDVRGIHCGEPLPGHLGDYLSIVSALPNITDSVMQKWVLAGFFSSKQLRLKPLALASEGIDNLEISEEKTVLDAMQYIMDRPGWISAFNELSKLHPVVVRRNTLGESRILSQAGLPISWAIDAD